MSELESLLSELQHTRYRPTNDVYNLFSKFYKNEGERVKRWASNLFQQEAHLKSKDESDKLRQKGNELYVKGRNLKSLESYTKALSYADTGTESYGIVLANRSAVLYSIEEYKSSLRDIGRCLLSNYPDKFKYKVFIRKINCYDKLGDMDGAEGTLKEAFDFVTSNTDFTKEEKEFYIEKLSQTQRHSPTTTDNGKYEYELPNITNKNEQLLGATSLINLRSSPEKGRYTVAGEYIPRGTILFIEKAYVFAPIFDENGQLHLDRCYSCLKTNRALIPCFGCVSCLYCDDTCREKSWNEHHRWECKGFRVNLWNTLSVGFLGFKVFLRNLPLVKRPDDRNEILRPENYKLANELVVNIPRPEILLEFLVLTAVTLFYLESETNFFDWLNDQLILEDGLSLETYLGGTLLKNIAQITSNACVIEHWNTNNYKYVPREKIPIATGLYPAVSMMNHSCKSNISMYYIDDTVVIKAIDNVQKGEELCNCYGVDYRYSSRQERQRTLQIQYQFWCSCEICEHPRLERDFLNAFRCPLCSGAVSPKCKECYDCKKTIDVSKFVQFEKEAKQYLRKEILFLDDIEEAYKLMRKIYNGPHINFAKCYDRYSLYYYEIDQFDKSIENFGKWLDIKKKHYGDRALIILKEILEFLDELKMKRAKNSQPKIEEFYSDLDEILPLYYPDHLIDYDALDKLKQ